jgi:hypothetical protein
MLFDISTNCTVRQAKGYSTTICSVVVHNQGSIHLMLHKTLYIQYLVFRAPRNKRIGLICSRKLVPIHIANTFSWAMTFPANHKLPCLWMTSSHRSSTATSVEELRGNNMESFCKSCFYKSLAWPTPSSHISCLLIVSNYNQNIMTKLTIFWHIVLGKVCLGQ